MDVRLKVLVTFDSSDYLAWSPGQFTAGERAHGTIILDWATRIFGQAMNRKSSIYSRTEHQSRGIADCSLLTILTELPSFTFPNYWLKLSAETDHKFLRCLICNYRFVACSYHHVWSKFRVNGWLYKFLYLARYSFYMQMLKIRTTESDASSWLCANTYAQICKKLLNTKG